MSSPNHRRSEPDQANGAKAMLVKKNPIHSLLTSLPIIMLVAGLWFYFNGEKKEREGQLIVAASQTFSGQLRGVTAQGSSATAQRILWVQTESRVRGVRVTLQQAQEFSKWQKGSPVTVVAAPRVDSSKKLWLYRAGRSAENLVDFSLPTSAP